ncbi:MAG: TIGR03619 family F420-dependent LLM class oxidoreductase [Micromonosporaceae bacterium]|nr:TIGR03619 family F420-dependent LLM class oxidoreductase [Micromonosporaceae bacterium]
MRFGLLTPIVQRIRHLAPADWEERAGPAELVDLAGTADALGFDYLTAFEHVAIPEPELARRGPCFWDPLATLSFLAARTRRIRLATQVIVLGYHHPLEVAKRFGTLDLLSGGRLVLGVGVGSLAAEFALLGHDFAGRGARADEMIEALRTCLSTPRATFHGRFYSFEGWHVEPVAVQERVPIWVGGQSRRSLRRACELGDGWVPFQLDLADLRAMLRDARPRLADRPVPLEVVLRVPEPLDPLGAPHRCTAAVDQLRDLGATAVSVYFRHTSPAHYRDQLHAFAQLFALPTGPAEESVDAADR